VASNGSELASAEPCEGTAQHSRPLIGLTAYGERAAFGVWDLDAVLLPRSYSDMVVAAGGVPVLLPPVPEAAAAVDRLDGVVLSGGADIGSDRYGAPPHPRAGSPRPDRDETELSVLARALDRDIPVLGVCRGAQLLNVALGGTLVQHLPDTVGHHGHNPRPGVFGTVTVELEPAGRVGALLGPRVRAQCHHHQAIDRLADGLLVTGRAAVDGTVEAVELAGRGFVIGVQWHPEQDDLRLFGALVAAALARQENA
jgi:gamma-glutamyl-gamma-aminobutyrate hydrolase PuuD